MNGRKANMFNPEAYGANVAESARGCACSCGCNSGAGGGGGGGSAAQVVA
jgi:hypothetical protein